MVGPRSPSSLGLFTAIYGVVFAAAQTDMKRLLAFSSIENIGILFTGVGLAIVFLGVGMTTLAALALIAVLYHAINHAFMKSLLFLGTGSVLHATGERNLGRLGGLIHRMPWVAWLTLVGALAIAGLPPLNGFVSEWLLLQAFLSAHEVPRSFVNMLLPLGAAVIALAAALAAYVMVKFFGVVFLGQPREAGLAKAHDAGWLERVGLLWLAAGCVALGLMPTQVIGLLALIPEQLGHHRCHASRVELVAPGSRGRARGGVRAAGVPVRHRRDDRRHRAAGQRVLSPPKSVARRRGTAASHGSTRACRTRRRASASRFATSSCRSSTCSANCPRPSIARHITAS